MSKRPPLNLDALTNAAQPQPDPVQLAIAKPGQPAAPPPKVKEEPIKAQHSRAHRVQIQGYFPDETRRRLKTLAAREGRTVEALLTEAIDDLLAKFKA